MPKLMYERIPDIPKYLLDKPANASDLYEFGVFKGDSLCETLDHFLPNNIRAEQVFGFDSFQGLPEEEPGLPICADWLPGAWDSRKNFATSSEAALEKVRFRLLRYPVKHTLIPGWFSDICTPENFRKYGMGPAVFVNVDCDLYISAKQCLTFLFQNKIPVKNTIIRFDDWFSYNPEHCVPEWTGGESLAHKEIQSEFNVEFERLSMNVFRVLNY